MNNDTQKKSMSKKAKRNWIIFALLLISFFLIPSDGKAKSNGTPIAFTVVEDKVNTSAAINRNRLDLTIMPSGDQSNATQADLLATIKSVAVDYQERTDLPVIKVKMNQQESFLLAVVMEVMFLVRLYF